MADDATTGDDLTKRIQEGQMLAEQLCLMERDRDACKAAMQAHAESAETWERRAKEAEGHLLHDEQILREVATLIEPYQHAGESVPDALRRIVARLARKP